MLSDLRFAFRALAKTPGFAFIAIFTLAMAIGVNSAIFSIANALVFRPLYERDPEEIVNVFTARQQANRDYRQFSHEEYLTLRATNDAFADVAALEFSLAGIGEQDHVRRSFVFLSSENYFDLVGSKPAAGRFYTAEECRPNAGIPVVVASYPFWQRAGGGADFVGSKIRINGQPFTVIGVTPRGFSCGNALLAPELWLPLGASASLNPMFTNRGDADLSNPRNYALNLVARLQPGMSREQTETRLPVLAARLDALSPGDAGGPRELQIQKPSRLSLSTAPSDDGKITVFASLLLAMAGAVLLIACLNLANMLLARGTSRAKEIAIRLSLGASRWRIVRHLLAEGLMLSLAGGALGLLMSMWATEILAASLGALLSSMNFALVVDARPDAAVIGATFGFAALATLLFCLGPSLKAARANTAQDLKRQTGESGGSGYWNHFFSARNCLVMAQVSLSLMLVFSALLFFHGAIKAAGVAPGFDTRGGIVAEVDYALANRDETSARQKLIAAVERTRALPGVRATALSTQVPFGIVTKMTSVAADSPAEPGKTPPVFTPLFTAITGEYFDAIGVRLLRGRTFTAVESSDPATARVAIVDEMLAAAMFPDGDVIGRRIHYTIAPKDGSPAEMEIVGIVSAHRHDVLSNIGRGQRLFVPFAQSSNSSAFIHVRLVRDESEAVEAMLDSVRRALRETDADMPVLQLLPLSQLIDKNIGLWVVRVVAILFGVFGAVALGLAVVGVYGVKAYAVSRRTKEIGIRMALGARPSDVARLLMKQGVQQTALAVAIGIVLAALAGQALASMLLDVSPSDPLSLAVATTVLAGAALLACWLPARRAMRVSPMRALRDE